MKKPQARRAAVRHQAGIEPTAAIESAICWMIDRHWQIDSPTYACRLLFEFGRDLAKKQLRRKQESDEIRAAASAWQRQLAAGHKRIKVSFSKSDRNMMLKKLGFETPKVAVLFLIDHALGSLPAHDSNEAANDERLWFWSAYLRGTRSDWAKKKSRSSQERGLEMGNDQRLWSWSPAPVGGRGDQHSGRPSTDTRLLLREATHRRAARAMDNRRVRQEVVGMSRATRALEAMPIRVGESVTLDEYFRRLDQSRTNTANEKRRNNYRLKRARQT